MTCRVRNKNPRLFLLLIHREPVRLEGRARGKNNHFLIMIRPEKKLSSFSLKSLFDETSRKRFFYSWFSRFGSARLEFFEFLNTRFNHTKTLLLFPRRRFFGWGIRKQFEESRREKSYVWLWTSPAHSRQWVNKRVEKGFSSHPKAFHWQKVSSTWNYLIAF